MRSCRLIRLCVDELRLSFCTRRGNSSRSIFCAMVRARWCASMCMHSGRLLNTRTLTHKIWTDGRISSPMYKKQFRDSPIALVTVPPERYNPAASMRLKALLSAGFIFHALIGNFCMMMPMAYAMESETHDIHEEIAMTPVTLVSSVHCADCAKTKLSAEHVPLKTSSCAGHCLSQARNATISSFSLSLPQVPAPAAIPMTVAWAPPSDFRVALTARPPNTISTRTIILRL